MKVVAKKFSVLIASASDCNELRDRAYDVFADKNKSLDDHNNTFLVFDWRKDAKPELVDGKFQDKIFVDAEKFWGKDYCDILVIIFWHKFGKGTKEEYEYFIRKKEDGKIGKLFVCHYNQTVKPLEIENSKIDDLFSWTKKHKDKWSEISPVRGGVDNPMNYYRALYAALETFHKENA
jgi:hypothetical protein